MSFFPGKDPDASNAYQCDAIAHVVAVSYTHLTLPTIYSV